MLGKASLSVRQLNRASVKSISQHTIKRDSMLIRRSPVSDLFNSFIIHFYPYHALNTISADACMGVIDFSDSVSQERYGLRTYSGNDNFLIFDAVKDPVMVLHVGIFIMEFYSRVRKIPEFGLFLDNMELEPADTLSLTHRLDSMSALKCEVLKIVRQLGSARDDKIDSLKLTCIENGN